MLLGWYRVPDSLHINIRPESGCRLNLDSSVKRTLTHWSCVQFWCCLHHSAHALLWEGVSGMQIAGFLAYSPLSWSLLETVLLEIDVPVAAERSLDNWVAVAVLWRLDERNKYQSSLSVVALGRPWPGRHLTVPIVLNWLHKLEMTLRITSKSLPTWAWDWPASNLSTIPHLIPSSKRWCSLVSPENSQETIRWLKKNALKSATVLKRGMRWTARCGFL